MSLQPFDPSSLKDNASMGSGIANNAQPMERIKTSYSDEATRKRHAPHKGMPLKVAFIGLVCFFAVVVVIVVVNASQCSEKIAVIEQEQAETTVDIPNGYGTGDISRLLRDEGVIASTTAFIQAVAAQGAEGALQAGTYTFMKGMTYEQIVSMLVAGTAASGVSITIPEGFTVAQTAQRFADTFGFSYDDFMAQAKASNYVGEFTYLNGAYNNSLEGFLFPKTYTFEDEVTPDIAIRTMLKQFQVETAGIDWSHVGQGNTVLSEYQVVCMASLIERETAVEAERPNVASVIYNRLNAGWYLQIDAAIAYALNKADLLTPDEHTALQQTVAERISPTLAACAVPFCTITLSVQSSADIARLRELLTLRLHEWQQAGGSAGDVIVSNLRHYEALSQAQSSIQRVIAALRTDLSGDFISQDLRECIHHLSDIVGEVTPESVLHTLFQHFCIGK